MRPSITLPPTDLLWAFTTSHDESDNLVYENLKKSVMQQKAFFPLRQRHLDSLKPGSLEWEEAAIKLAQVELQNIAFKYINTLHGQRDQLAKTFTDASIDLYGQPEAIILSELASSEIEELNTLRGSLPKDLEHNLREVIGNYEGFVKAVDTKKNETNPTKVTQQLKALISKKYAHVFETLPKDTGQPVTPDALLKIFEHAKDTLASDDIEWTLWRAIEVESAIVSVNSQEHLIKVGNKRRPLSVAELKPLIAHELLVHASRGVNGSKNKNSLARTGLPDYEQAEEGLGIYVEWLLTDKIPQKAKDRYIDIALALGMNPELGRLSRRELYKHAYKRELLRKRAFSNQVNESQISSGVWTHVDRIFRGTPGDSSGGVFTKDVLYYDGFVKMRDYIDDKFKKGYNAEQIWDYLMCAKFDPTKKAHIVYIKQKTGKFLD